jgi:carbon dioxide concentrating mechanism protein CcmN
MVVVEPGSIIGDGSRQVEKNGYEQPATRSSTNGKNVDRVTVKSDRVEKPQHQTAQNSNSIADSPSVTQAETSTSISLDRQKKPVVGQLYINELLITLFPHNKTPHSNSQS